LFDVFFNDKEISKMKIRDPPKGRSKQEGTYITRENPERNKA
jgi:hypothetical protein